VVARLIKTEKKAKERRLLTARQKKAVNIRLSSVFLVFIVVLDGGGGPSLYVFPKRRCVSHHPQAKVMSGAR
jgi:hypothetical protein